MTGNRQLMTRSSVRLRPDFNRLAKGVSRPGIDPRSWVVMARVDDDEDATVWDAEIGWIVDVTFLDGEGPVTCRVVSSSQGSDAGSSRPVRPGALVVVLIPNGDPNYDAIIIGDLHDVDDVNAPTTINGDEITESFALTTHIDAFPDEDLDQEWRNARITAESMILGEADADQSYMRGDDYVSKLDDFLDAIRDFCQALISATPAAPNGALTQAEASAAAAELLAATVSFKASSSEYLSTRIKGD